MELFQLIADAINPVLDELFPSDVTVIAEPGRYFAMSTTTMAVQIHSKREYFGAPTVCFYFFTFLLFHFFLLFFQFLQLSYF
jgi:hypothetical protein